MDIDKKGGGGGLKTKSYVPVIKQAPVALPKKIRPGSMQVESSNSTTTLNRSPSFGASAASRAPSARSATRLANPAHVPSSHSGPLYTAPRHHVPDHGSPVSPVHSLPTTPIHAAPSYGAPSYGTHAAPAYGTHGSSYGTHGGSVHGGSVHSTSSYSANPMRSSSSGYQGISIHQTSNATTHGQVYLAPGGNTLPPLPNRQGMSEFQYNQAATQHKLQYLKQQHEQQKKQVQQGF